MEKETCFGVGLFIGAIFGTFVTLCIITEYPTSMDVYQGKTTLEYVVVDGQVTDSMVIWKKDIYDR